MAWDVGIEYVAPFVMRTAFEARLRALRILHPLTHEMRLLWMLLAISAYTAAADQIQGEILIMEGPISHKIWLKAAGKGYIPINKTNETLRFKTGTFVKGYYTTTKKPLITLQNVTIYYPSTSYTSQISSITYILNICDRKNVYNATSIKDMWFTRPISLKATFQNCSWGVSSFTEANNIIVGPLTIPCGIFDLSQCSGGDLYGIVDYADNYTKEALKIDVSKYNRRIVMLPSLSTCMWAGLGNVGCGTKCMAWINGAPNIRLSTIFHELGHTLGLMHSSRDNSEYGDATCAMGVSLSSNACYNVAHNSLLGWGSSLLVIDNVPSPFSVNLPSLAKAKGNMVKIGNLFLSFTGGTTVFQSPSFYNKILVHYSSNIGLPEPSFTSLLSVLDPGMKWVQGLIRITFVSYSGEIAVLKIEPKVLPVCGDGICNGVETKVTCPIDCCPKSFCGDNRCDMWAGENCMTCPKDCNVFGSTCCGSKINGCNSGVCKLWARTCNVACV